MVYCRRPCCQRGCAFLFRLERAGSAAGSGQRGDKGALLLRSERIHQLSNSGCRRKSFPTSPCLRGASSPSILRMRFARRTHPISCISRIKSLRFTARPIPALIPSQPPCGRSVSHRSSGRDKGRAGSLPSPRWFPPASSSRETPPNSLTTFLPLASRHI